MSGFVYLCHHHVHRGHRHGNHRRVHHGHHRRGSRLLHDLHGHHHLVLWE